ncbi:YqgE/AlgH family protein [Cochlodiniinecator piscidefendens]|uniref:YqgE/AlgH family protein n=1 Tax=Cochlodiniinecator piscidefendens TaxID=2715756 RepID=UPI00140BDCEF|nr:YqgE/AlgH family protein [Cochlodiniinecator piscidefendens]
MTEVQGAEYLSGKFLIAMPGMGDTRFEKSVVFLCAHSEDGAMGLIVNKPSADLQFSEMLDQLSIDVKDGVDTPDIHFGGPVEIGRGFVLHTTDYGTLESTLQVDERFSMTATRDVLEDIAQGQGPNKALLALGYSGWGAGQLETEISSNGWLICDALSEIVFDERNSSKWEAALRSMGVNPLLLAASAGHA